MNSTSFLSFYSNGSSSGGSLPSPPRKMRRLEDFYEVINPIDDDLTLYCLLFICETIVFDKSN